MASAFAMPLRCATACAVVPCAAAMSDSVSPETTV